jgi:hypothetical protein
MNMDRVTCVLSVPSDVGHLQQLLTGFVMLAHRGILKLKQELHPQDLSVPVTERWAGHESYNLIAAINGTRIAYNTHDAAWTDPVLVRSTDFCFKRSFDANWIRKNLPTADQPKVFPLGLNYQVESSGFDRFKIQRANLYAGRERIRTLLKGLAVDRLLRHGAVERLQSMESLPSPDQDPRVLFMTRVWDPDLLEDQSQRDVIRDLNESRAMCVRVLRNAWGARFSGGLAREPYALHHFGDAVVDDNRLTNKRLYLDLVREHPICVATTGLNGSIGWKLGEYVAFSRAIVSEPLLYEIPGPFTAGPNYLEFTTPENLLQAVGTLADDRSRRADMMSRNREYYLNFVRPDALVMRSLVTAGILRRR